MSEITQNTDYQQSLVDIRQRIQAAQIRAVIAVNSELLGLYWDIGHRLLRWQSKRGCDRLACDLSGNEGVFALQPVCNAADGCILQPPI